MRRDHVELCFTNVDYYCKIWLNGVYLGSHEGYSAPFSFSLDEVVQRNGKNRLIVKVWSPWDEKVAADQQEKRTFAVYRNMVKGTYEHSEYIYSKRCKPGWHLWKRQPERYRKEPVLQKIRNFPISWMKRWSVLICI